MGAPRLAITGGELRGRRLVSPPQREGLRPTTGRIREAIFSILGPLDGERVLDLCAGSGALGLEALSRGAGSATFIDRDPRPVERNVSELDLSDRCEVLRADVTRPLSPGLGHFDLVFCDPPYRLADRFGPPLDKSLPALLRGDARVVIETGSEGGLELALPLLTERRHGAALIRIHGAPR